MKYTAWMSNAVAQVKTFAMNVAALSTLGVAVFTATLPDTTPIDTARYEAVAINGKLYVSVDIAKDSTYGADVVFYAGNDYIGSMPIPQVGHRVTTATYNLPPGTEKKANINITAYWKIDHWTSTIWPQELFYRIEVKNATAS